MKLRTIIFLLLSFLIMLTSCNIGLGNNEGSTANLITDDAESVASRGTRPYFYRGLKLTGFWTFDPNEDMEDVTLTGVTIQMKFIDPAIPVNDDSDPNNDVNVTTISMDSGLASKYLMEGSGKLPIDIADPANEDENDPSTWILINLVQDFGGSDPAIATFMKVSPNRSKWGLTSRGSSLDYWRTLAVASEDLFNGNIPVDLLTHGLVRIKAFIGMPFPDERGNLTYHDGWFRITDNSWSFSDTDWVDVFYGSHANYEYLDDQALEWYFTEQEENNWDKFIKTEIVTNVENETYVTWYAPSCKIFLQWPGSSPKPTSYLFGVHNLKGTHWEDFNYPLSYSWTVNNLYVSGNVVKYNGADYVCKVYEETSLIGREPDKAYMWAVWEKISDEISLDEWTTDKYYYPDDFVLYAGDSYKCTYTDYALIGREPDKSYMWAIWEKQ